MKRKFVALMLLAALSISVSNLSFNVLRPCYAVGYNFTAPVGVYNVSISVPKTIRVGEPLTLTVSINLTGLNTESPWYNWTVVEGIEAISVSIVEAGIRMETYPNQIMLTNPNASIVKPTANYYVNATSITRSLTCNSTTLTVGPYSVHVLVKGFRYAVWGLSMGYSNFYIEKGTSMDITFQVVREFSLQSFNITIPLALASTLTAIIAAKKLRKRLNV